VCVLLDPSSYHLPRPRPADAEPASDPELASEPQPASEPEVADEAPFELFEEELGPEAPDSADAADAAGVTGASLMADLGESRRAEAVESARKLESIARLHRRPEMIPLPARPSRGRRYRDLTPWDLTKEEIRTFFGLTHREAERMLDAAIMLTSRLPRTMAELKAGRLGYARAAKIAHHAKKVTDHHYDQAIERGLSPETAEEVASATGARLEEAILERATSMLPWDLEQALIATVMLIDPAFAIAQRKTNHRGRGVSHRTNPGEGTGDLFARLPAAEALAIYTTLDAYARRFRDTGDPRTLDELRADALMGIFFDKIDRSGPETEADDRIDDDGSMDHGSRIDSDGVADDDSCGDDDDSIDDDSIDDDSIDDGETHPASCIDDAAGDRIRPDCSSDDVEEASGGTARDVRSRGDADAPALADRAAADENTSAGSGVGGSWTMRSRPPVSRLRTEVHVTVELSTLMGLNDRPGELAGHGPIDAEYARALAFGPESTWRRLVTDPLSGQLLDLGRTRYRPPAALADHVRTRDTSCRTPGCSRPAAACDLDHVIAYPAGATSDDNLHAKCRRDHRIKHEGRWRHEVSTNPDHPPHTIVLTSPMGEQYLTQATVFIRPRPKDSIRPRPNDRPTVWPDPGPCPF
jgi:Domain of unknown function (DUF222)